MVLTDIQQYFVFKIIMKEIEIAVPLGKTLRPDEVKKAVARRLGLSKKAVIRVVDPTSDSSPMTMPADVSYSSPASASSTASDASSATPNATSRAAADAVCVIVRRSLDARASEPVWRYRVQIYTGGEEFIPYHLSEYQDVHGSEPVIVAGAGPAGMFAALKLLSLGLKPIVLERGKDVHARKLDIARLSREGVVNPESNYCFGEGGAGTFSDGKLFTRSSKRGDIREVLYQLVRFGADSSILIDAHPHIGTDRLPLIVENIRKTVIKYGGEYHFDTCLTDMECSESGVRVMAGKRVFTGAALILATGHSARDVYEMLARKGFTLEAKGFALGVRVEHRQSVINRARYHGRFREGMPAAEYTFVEQIEGRGVFSFCMCPGGVLVPSSTEAETVVLNGMSNSSRNSKWANAGVVVQIEPEDIPSEYAADGAFGALNFQRDVERSMFSCRASAVNPMAAPAQRMTDFCSGRVSDTLPETSYHPGTVSSPLHKMLPDFVAGRLQKLFPLVDRKIPGYFSRDALLLGVESRTSSPVRIVRDPESLSCRPRVYPCGEGAGYSGGIVSSAIDGIRCAFAAASEITSLKAEI